METQLDKSQLSPKAILITAGTFLLTTAIVVIVINAIGIGRIRSVIEDAGPMGPLVFIGIRIATTVFPPLSAGPIQLTAGMMFGLFPALFYSMVATGIGGSINFTIARTLGRRTVRNIAGTSAMERIDHLYQQAGQVWGLIFARLFLSSIYDYISYAAGLTSIGYRPYILITIGVGVIPTFGTIVTGMVITENNPVLTFLYVFLGVSFIVPLVIYTRFKRRHSIRRFPEQLRQEHTKV